jgi:hypothetical protein
VIFGYDYDGWAMDPAIEAFETLASERVILGQRHEAAHGHLMHPVHQRGRVFAWEIASRPVPGVRTFTETTPSLEDFWRSIILLGRNVASYKFAPGKSLLELAHQDHEEIPLDELAVPFSRHLCEHLKLAGAGGGSSLAALPTDLPQIVQPDHQYAPKHNRQQLACGRGVIARAISVQLATVIDGQRRYLRDTQIGW